MCFIRVTLRRTAGHHIVDFGRVAQRITAAQQIIGHALAADGIQSGLAAHARKLCRRDEFFPVVRAFGDKFQQIFRADNQMQIRFGIAVDGGKNTMPSGLISFAQA